MWYLIITLINFINRSIKFYKNSEFYYNSIIFIKNIKTHKLSGHSVFITIKKFF